MLRWPAKHNNNGGLPERLPPLHIFLQELSPLWSDISPGSRHRENLCTSLKDFERGVEPPTLEKLQQRRWRKRRKWIKTNKNIFRHLIDIAVVCSWNCSLWWEQSKLQMFESQSKNSSYVCRSCGTLYVGLITKCHDSNKHNESTLATLT